MSKVFRLKTLLWIVATVAVVSWMNAGPKKTQDQAHAAPSTMTDPMPLKEMSVATPADGPSSSVEHSGRSFVTLGEKPVAVAKPTPVKRVAVAKPASVKIFPRPEEVTPVVIQPPRETRHPIRPQTQTHGPIRSARFGQGCDCPYDHKRNGNRCGGTSAYARPGGRSPVCYTGD